MASDSTSRRSERVDDKSQRRVFAPEYKLAVLREIDERRDKRGSVGEILRREGLYASHVTSWRKELEEELAGRPRKKRGPKADPTAPFRKEIERLNGHNARLQERLRQAELIIAAQKKIAAMFPEEPEARQRSEEKD